MKVESKNTALGIVCIIAAALLWGVCYFILKLIAGEIGPFTVTFLESISGIVAMMLIYRVRPKDAVRAAKTGGWRILAVAFLAITFANSIFILALNNIDLGVASILEKTQPIFTLILAVIFLKERIALLSVVFGLLGLIGAIAVVPFAQHHNFMLSLNRQTVIGVSAALAAAVGWAGSTIIGRNLAVSGHGHIEISFLRIIFGAITVLPLCLIYEMPHWNAPVPWRSVGLACLSGIIDGVLSNVLYYRGMKYVAAGVSGVLEIITPVAAVLLGVAILGEHLSLRQTIGAFIVLLSVTALVWNEVRKKEKQS
jgi:drug/metabolite transporter, DME family